MPDPIVSVIMPFFNTEKYVKEAIESVLRQTYTSFEFICINDGSTDTSESIVRSFGDKLTLLSLPQNSGIAVARNEGIRIARGTYIAFADADDIWKREKLQKQVSYLDTHPESAMVFCFMECFLSPDMREEIKQIRECPVGTMPGMIPPTVLIRKTVFDDIGLLNPAFRVGEFIDFMARVQEAHLRYGMIDEVLFLRRIHETNTGVSKRSYRTDYARVLKEALDRRRVK